MNGESRRYLDLLSGGLSISLGNCRADEIDRAGALLPESVSIEFDMPLTLVKLLIAQKFLPTATIDSPGP